MPPKYYCDYCDKQFHDTPPSRKRHVKGFQHQLAKKRWFDSFSDHEEVKQGVCSYYIRTGFCQYGLQCKYSHPPIPDPLNLSIDGGSIALGLTSPALFAPVVEEVTPVITESKLPRSLQPPPDGGYPYLPPVDWG